MARKSGKRLWRWILLALVLGIAYVAVFGVILHIDKFRGEIESGLSAATGFDVRIDGTIEVLIALRPAARVRDVSITHPDTAITTELMHGGMLAAKIDLLSLLRDEILVKAVHVSDVVIDAHIDQDGRSNWVIVSEAAPKPVVASDGEQRFEFVGVNSVELENINFRYRDDRSGAELKTALDRASATAARGEFLNLSLSGSIAGQPFELDVEADSFDDLIRTRRLSRSEFEGKLARIAFSGYLAADWSGDRPMFDAALRIPELALQESEADSAATEISADGKTRLEELYEIDLSSELNLAFDGRLQLDIDKIIGAPLDIESLHFDLDDRGSSMSLESLEIGIAGDVITGRADIDVSKELPTFDLSLGSEQLVLTNADPDTGLDESFHATLSDVNLTAKSVGQTVGGLIESLDVDFDIGVSELRFGDRTSDRYVPLSLNNFNIDIEKGRKTTVSANGNLLEKDIELIATTGGPMSMLSAAQWPIDLTLKQASARLEIQGHAIFFRAYREMDAQVSLVAGRIGDLGAWFGWHPDSKLPFELRGQFNAARRVARIDDLHLRIGDSAISGYVAWDRSATEPRYEVSLQSDQLDTADFQHLAAPDTRRSASNTKVGLDMPILPSELVLPDADIRVRIGRLTTWAEVSSDVRLDAKLRGGTVQESSFAVTIAEERFEGRLEADFRGVEGKLDLTIATTNADYGRLLSHYGVADDIKATAGSVSLNTRSTGTNLRELLSDATYTVQAADLVVKIEADEMNKEWDLELDHLQASGHQNDPTLLTAEGRVNEQSINFTLTLPELDVIFQQRQELPVHLHLEILDDTFDFDLLASLPLSKRIVDVDFKIQGKRIDVIDRFFKLKDAPLGPYEINGKLRLDDSGYYLSDLDIRIGSSELKGSVDIIARPDRSLIDARVNATSFQFDDFVSPAQPIDQEDSSSSIPVVDTKRDEDKKEETEQEIVTEQRTMSDWLADLEPLFDLDLDLSLDLSAANVRSGDDLIGGGHVQVRLTDKLLEIRRAHLDVAGGKIDIDGAIRKNQESIEANLNIDVENFDYGIAARRRKSDTLASGLYSLRVDLNSQAEELGRLLANAHGEVAFGVWPNELEGGVFDFWSTNLLFAVVPLVGKQDDSSFNCLVGNFNIEDGLMRENAALIDTSRTMIYVRGDVNFKTTELDLLFLPKQKQRVMFSWSTPIKVTGTFDRMRVRMSPVDLVRGTVGLALSPVTTTSDRMFGKAVPPDGSDLCRELFKANLDAKPAQ